MIYVYIGLVVCLFTVNAFVQKLISFKKASFNLIYVPGLTCTFLTMVFFFYYIYLLVFKGSLEDWRFLFFILLILHLLMSLYLNSFSIQKSYPFILLFNMLMFLTMFIVMLSYPFLKLTDVVIIRHTYEHAILSENYFFVIVIITMEYSLLQ